MTPYCDHNWSNQALFDLNGWESCEEWACTRCHARWTIITSHGALLSNVITQQDGQRQVLPLAVRPDPPDPEPEPAIVYSPRMDPIPTHVPAAIRSDVERIVRDLEGDRHYVEPSRVPAVVLRDDGEWYYHRSEGKVEVFHRDGSEEDTAIWSYELTHPEDPDCWT